MGKVGTGLGINQANDYAGATIPLLMIGTLSVPTVAAAAVATKIWTIYCRVPQACFTASFVFYGYAAGRDEAEARDVVRRLRGYSMAPTLIAAAVFLLASPLLVRLFGGSSIDMGLTVGLLGAYFLSIGGYFYGAFYGELLSVRQEGVFLSSRSTIVTYAVAIPLAAIAVFVFESAFLALASGAIPAALLAVMFARRIKELSATDVQAAAA
jgi:Na+-driven multidrug efflux pump